MEMKKEEENTPASKLNARARRIHPKNERVWTMKPEENPVEILILRDLP